MAAPWVYIKDLKEHVGESVCVKGWMYNNRSSGKIHFLQLRDGSGTVQGVMVKGEVPDEQFDAAKGLWLEASLEVTGVVRADSRAPSPSRSSSPGMSSQFSSIPYGSIRSVYCL